MATFNVNAGFEEIRRRVLVLQGILAGSQEDRFDIARGFRLRLAVAFLSKIKQAYEVKAAGGRDEANIQWPPLKPRTLAYSRRGVVRTVRQREQQRLPRPTRFVGVRASRRQGIEAAARRTGGRTKIETARRLSPGADYQILRDTGILFNSLSPGVVTASGKTASYSKPTGNGGEKQKVEATARELIVGTTVAYARTHHVGDSSRGIPARPLWPEPEKMPESWLRDFAETASRGIETAVQIVVAEVR